MSETIHSTIEDTLSRLNNPHVYKHFYDLLSGTPLTTINQRKQRALSGYQFDKYHDIGIAVELYKQNKLILSKRIRY